MTGWTDRMKDDPTSWLLEADHAGQPSKWVTLRACAVLNAVARARA